MIKSVKRLSAAILSAVMMLTAVATPLGDNLTAVRESTSLTADNKWCYNNKMYLLCLAAGIRQYRSGTSHAWQWLSVV